MKLALRSLVVLASLLAALAVTAGPVQASGPTPGQPSTAKVGGAAARKAAASGLRAYLVGFMAGPATSRVGRCSSGPYLWLCPATVHSSDASCTATVAVWSDEENYYMELRHLRCRGA